MVSRISMRNGKNGAPSLARTGSGNGNSWHSHLPPPFFIRRSFWLHGSVQVRLCQSDLCLFRNFQRLPDCAVRSGNIQGQDSGIGEQPQFLFGLALFQLCGNVQCSVERRLQDVRLRLIFQEPGGMIGLGAAETEVGVLSTEGDAVFLGIAAETFHLGSCRSSLQQNTTWRQDWDIISSW